MKTALRTILFVLLTTVAVAHAAPPKLPVTTFRLANGLTVLVSEDHTVPIVAVDIWYHVGSKDEKPGKTGFAHLFEHMMFKGSAHVGDGQFFRLIAEAGGWNNGTTNRQRTNYLEVMPSNFLERALFMEADRMGFLLDTVDQAKLDNQRDVVKNERRQNYENRPYGMSGKAIAEALYPEGHPYHWLTIGDHKDLEAASLDDVKQFFRDWYTPSNAAIALVGDVTVAEARRLVERWFGGLSGPKAPPRVKPVAVPLPSEKRIELEDKVTLERLYLVWPSPGSYTKEDADLDLLATMLSSKSGRLYKRLVYELQVAQSVSSYQNSQSGTSEFTVVVTAKPGHTAAEMEKLVDEELKKLLGPQPITPAELERSRNAFEASFTYSLEEVGGFSGRADRLNAYFDHYGRADALDADLRRYLETTPQRVMATARRVLLPGRVVLTVKPAAAAPTATGGGR